MLQFHQHIIGDLLADSGGGLVVLSSGLGLNRLLSSLIQHHHDASKGTVLVLNATSSSSSLSSHCDSISGSITSDLPVQHRLSLYTSGGVFLITTRILIVDLLTRRLPISSLAGLIILNAHSLSETSTEAFIVRILRSYSNGVNRNDSPLYVWAFTDRPQAMVSGFAKAERILKCLYLRRLHLWPRFHVYVSEDLERAPPEVIDIRVPMSSYMIKIQKAVIEVMDACLKEMRKTNKVDVEDLTVENALFKSFDEIVRRQLDPIWHTLGKRTKQLVSDLKTLRKLLDYLARYDAVTYLKYLDSLRASESFRSVWIFAESSYKIFEYAKKRVYRFGRPDVEKSNLPVKTASTKKRKLEGNRKKDDPSASIETGVVLEEVLEAPPKWKVLRDILVEIQEERQKQVTEGEQVIVGEKGDQGGIVLIACKDESSCMKLEDSIIKGQCQAMREEWEKYLLSKVELHALPKHNKKKPKTTTKGFGILDGITPSVSGQKAEVSSISKLENDALLAAAHEISKEAKRKSNVEEGNGDDLTTGKTSGNRQKKSKVGKTDPEPKTNIETGNSPPKHTTKKTGHSLLTGDHVSSSKSGHDVNDQLPSLHFHALDSGQIVLDALRPSVIILYHPDMAFVREIEIYKSENPAAKLKVYFLFYEGSTEVRKFEAGISRENGAFESLIRQKSLMMIPVSQDEQLREASTFLEPQAINAQNLLTRKAGGKKEAEKEMQVIVDMREFMSNLPNVLHQKGLRIIPVTLEVGDYILSPLICVERKSIQDLFGSFSSGRLFNQVEMMSRYYRIPVLLIEFSQDKSFSFQSASEISDDVTPNNIISKLSLLVLHFPRLRIVWSRSLHATAEIFAALKANQDEPDEAKAIRVGVPSEDGVIEDDVRAENYNTSAVEFLRRLPGVTDSNYRSIMDGCKSLSELALLPMEKLAQLMGGHKAAKTLRDFLDAKYPTLL